MLVEYIRLKDKNTSGTAPAPLVYPSAVNPNTIDWSLDVYAEPAGAGAGTIPAYLDPQTDPLTSATLTRVGDQTAFGVTDNKVGHNYSNVSPWNCTDTLLKLNGTPARYLDTTDWSIAYTTYDPPWANWSNVREFFIYGVVSGTDFVEVDVRTGGITTLRTFTGYTGVTIGNGEGNITDDDKYVCLVGTKTGTEWLISYDIELDTIVAELDLGTSGALDHAEFTNDGSYIVAHYTTDGSGASQGMKRYNPDLTGLTHLYDYTGHGDMCVDVDGNQVFVQFRNSSLSLGVTQRYMEMIRIDNALVTGLYFDSDSPAPRGVWGGHISYARGRQGWAYVSEGRASDDVMATKIFAIKLSTTEDLVEIYGTTNANPLPGYEHQAHGAVNGDGTKIVFKSNWYNTAVEGWNAAPAWVLEYPQI